MSNETADLITVCLLLLGDASISQEFLPLREKVDAAVLARVAMACASLPFEYIVESYFD